MTAQESTASSTATSSEVRPQDTRPQDPLIDIGVLRADLDAIAKAHADPQAQICRNLIKARLKQALGDGRAEAERRLLAHGKGRLCAELLSRLEDEIIRLLADFASQWIHAAGNRSDGEKLAIIAVGGYGRGTLAPGSDIDLLFVLPYKQTAWGETLVEYVLYMLWDLGQKVGHATRSLDECIRQAKGDMTIRTAMLESRFLWGEKALFSKLVERFDKEVAAGTGPEFVAAKLAERDERHRRAGMSRYLVEPNVKDGKGGQRDLQTLFWIGQYLDRVRKPEELVKVGVFDKDEYRRFMKCEDFLWTVRCHLHFVTGRADDRLSFEFQRPIAQRLGYHGHSGLKDVERFMKHYFLTAKAVGDLTRILAAALEDQQVKPLPLLNRVVQSLRSSKRVRVPKGFPDLRIINDRLGVADEGVFERDPVNLIRLFVASDKYDLQLHPDALKLITRSLKLINAKLRNDPEANRLFMEVLTSRNQPEATLRAMNEAGVLGLFVPDFGRVVAMMQFNMYHHYTVDEHTLRCIGALSDIEKGVVTDDLPLASQLIKSIESRRALYVALFLHDIAKGRPEDHSVAGAKIARSLCPRLGLTPGETETVAWLVQEHLVMSVVAQQRDLSDPRTINAFAAQVQSPERLKLLLILTVSDIRAVGPGVWNGWKGQLLRTLYYESEPVLAGGHSQIERKARVATSQNELRVRLGDWDEAELNTLINRHYPAYWLKVEIERKVQHAQLLRRAALEKKVLMTEVNTDAFRSITELTVLAPDHPRLLSTIAGACAAAGANIVDAQIFTTVDGTALDTIFITREFSEEADEVRRAVRIAGHIEKTLAGQMRITQAVAERAAKKARPKAFTVEPEVLINNTWSDAFTVIEVSGLDRPGLLYELTTTISDLNLNIASAHVATFGERAVDVFYVTDLLGHKVDNDKRKLKIRNTLLQVLDGTGSKAAEK
jgi:[protein-PII] uridylyltransferase